MALISLTVNKFLQPIGKNKFAAIPEKVAKFLNLPNPEKFTGRSMRLSSETVLKAIEEGQLHKRMRRFDDEVNKEKIKKQSIESAFTKSVIIPLQSK